MGHEIDINANTARRQGDVLELGGPQYYAVCSCGWEGGEHKTKDAAESEGLIHQIEARRS